MSLRLSAWRNTANGSGSLSCPRILESTSSFQLPALAHIAGPMPVGNVQSRTLSLDVRPANGRRLFVGMSWPIALMAIVAASSAILEVAQDRWSERQSLFVSRGTRTSVFAGLQRALPLTLLVTFTLVPSTATRIFRTFLCDPFEYNPADNATRRYMQDDMNTDCSTSEYAATWRVAVGMGFIWPVGGSSRSRPAHGAPPRHSPPTSHGRRCSCAVCYVAVGVPRCAAHRQADHAQQSDLLLVWRLYNFCLLVGAA